MPEPITTPATGSDPTPPATPNTTDLDLSKISDEQFAKVFDDPRLFKHDRFKALTDAKKERDELKTAQSKAEEDKLKANQEFEKLAAKNAKERDEYKSKADQAEINAEIVRFAASKGAIDLNAVKKLIDKGSVKFDDTGNIIGVEEAVTALEKASPYLFNGKGTPDIGRGTAPNNGNQGGKRFKLSQLNNARFYRENYADIQQAFKNGMVENDSGQTTQR